MLVTFGEKFENNFTGRHSLKIISGSHDNPKEDLPDEQEFNITEDAVHYAVYILQIYAVSALHIMQYI